MLTSFEISEGYCQVYFYSCSILRFKKNDLLHALIIYTCILHTKSWIKSSCNEQGSHINKYILDNWEFKYYAKNTKNI